MRQALPLAARGAPGRLGAPARGRLRLPSRLPAGRGGGVRPRRGPAPVQAAAGLPQALVGAAAKAGMLLPDLAHTAASSWRAAIDPAVLSATVNASGKLFLICAAVGWLLRTGRIPNSTATVMSQVSFQLLIPCMLFSKVANTLAANPDPTLLLGIAAAAVLQIAVGAACGLLLAPALGLGPPPAEQQQQRSSSSWQGRSSPAAASAIAASMATASGAPQAAAALRPKQLAPSTGPWDMVAPSAAFGNSFTLPAIYLTTLLPPALADRALGYAALFLLAWSPCLWSIGLALVGGKQRPPAKQQQGSEQQQGGEQQQGSEQQQPKPLDWRQPRVVDVTPLAVTSGSIGGSGSIGSGSSSSYDDSSGSVAAAAAAAAAAATRQQSVAEPPHWAERLAQHPTVARLCQFVSQVLNPPVVAILAGTAVGMLPAGRALLASINGSTAAAAAGGAAAAAAVLPPELGLLHSVVRAALEVIELLAAGTLATQTLVLAASLLQQPEPVPGAPAASVGPVSAATAAAATALHRHGGWLSAAKRYLLPSDGAEGRALLVLALARFLVVPLATIAGLQALVAGGLLPPIMSDPVLLFVLLIEACMPSAQNLIILLQLSEGTQRLAPSFARMLLKQYVLAVLPVTLWVTAFATNLSLPI